MKVAVATLQDSAAAQVAKEAIHDAGIPVEMRQIGADSYFGSGTSHTYELRVDLEHEADARGVLAQLEKDMELAAIHAAGVPPEEEEERGNATLPPTEERPRKISWAIALGLVGPVPGVGLLYARQFGLGWTMVGMSIALFLAIGYVPDGYGVMLGLKLLDVILAPIFAARFNRKLEERQHAAHP